METSLGYLRPPLMKKKEVLTHGAKEKDLCVLGSYFLFLEFIVIKSWLWRAWSKCFLIRTMKCDGIFRQLLEDLGSEGIPTRLWRLVSSVTLGRTVSFLEPSFRFCTMALRRYDTESQWRVPNKVTCGLVTKQALDSSHFLFLYFWYYHTFSKIYMTIKLFPLSIMKI